jgi:large subunit ribosomal protein L21e
MPPLGRVLVNYDIGDKVDIVIDSSQQRGQPHRRFHGKIGDVQLKQGKAYLISLKDGNKTKTLIIRPEHLRKHKI